MWTCLGGLDENQPSDMQPSAPAAPGQAHGEHLWRQREVADGFTQMHRTFVSNGPKLETPQLSFSEGWLKPDELKKKKPVKAGEFHRHLQTRECEFYTIPSRQ